MDTRGGEARVSRGAGKDGCEVLGHRDVGEQELRLAESEGGSLRRTRVSLSSRAARGSITTVVTVREGTRTVATVREEVGSDRANRELESRQWVTEFVVLFTEKRVHGVWFWGKVVARDWAHGAGGGMIHVIDFDVRRWPQEKHYLKQA